MKGISDIEPGKMILVKMVLLQGTGKNEIVENTTVGPCLTLFWSALTIPRISIQSAISTGF